MADTSAGAASKRRNLRQVRATEVERVRRAGPSWRAVIGVDEQASGEAARKKMRESMWCLCASPLEAKDQPLWRVCVMCLSFSFSNKSVRIEF